MSEIPKAAPDPLAVRSDIGSDRAASDLSPPFVGLDPVFPLEIHDTRLVLFDGTSDEVRVSWNLTANDYVATSSSFPFNAGRPFPVLRLRRLRGDGDSERVDEVRVRLEGNRGRGETGFMVGRDASRFEAEFGLVDANGGWLLLARSNRLEHAASIGLELPSRKDGEDDDSLSDPTLKPPRIELMSGFPLPGLVHGRSPGCSAESFARKQPELTMNVPAVPGADSKNESVGECLVEASQSAADNKTCSALSTNNILNGKETVRTDVDANDTRDVKGNGTASTSRIPTLVYGRPAPECARPLIEAELRIHGWAEPNTEIDLFGHRYRIGPGGRFQFVLKVDDPVLLKQALTLYPPPELNYPRDD